MNYYAVILDHTGHFNAIITDTDLTQLEARLNLWRIEDDISIAGIFKGAALDFEEKIVIQDK